MTEEARQARLEYRRQWAKANRDKIRGYNAKYWDKRAAAAKAAQAAEEATKPQEAAPAAD